MAIRKSLKAQPAQDTQPRCSRCRYFDRIEGKADLGHCRRYPMSGKEWPIVYPSEWCGEYLAASLPAETSDAGHLSIAEAGKRYFGLSVNGSYLAAKRGDLPWVKIGNRKRVPVAAMQHLTPRE
jgi:hypothetical protein